jgi:putative tryptophan/tyrosine transport system substrate-binding protein
MLRREFIAGLCGAGASSAAAWPLAARAQQPDRMRRIGVLMDGTETQTQSRLAAFVEGLRQLGWTEGQNLRMDVRWNNGDAGLAPTYAAQLIELMPDLILAGSTVNLTAIRQATSIVPVVFVQVADPVAEGFVASVRRPGGNLTGFSFLEFSLGSKWLDLLKQIVPGLARVVVMYNPDTAPQSKLFLPVIDAAAPPLGVQVIAAPVLTTADIEPALASFAGAPNGGLILLGSSFMELHHTLIADPASRYRLPSIGSGPNFAKDGGLMDYGPNPDLVSQFRQAATYVDRILKGEKPSDLPIQAPVKYTFVINLKTAKALGLTIPETLLATADEVIQ